MTHQYAKLATLHLHNFMSHQDTSIDFTNPGNKGVTHIIGNNSAGKSAITRALAIITTNHNAASQKYLIRHGANSFTVTATFTDETSISRTKYKNGKSRWVMTKGDDTILDTRSGDALTADDRNGPPPIITQYLALAEPTSVGSLHHRNIGTPLLLSGTSGAQNYESVATLLRARELFTASRAAQDAVNKAMKDAEQAALQVSMYESALAQYPSDESLTALMDSTTVLGRQAHTNQDVRGILERCSASLADANVHRQAAMLAPIDTNALEAALGMGDLLGRVHAGLMQGEAYRVGAGLAPIDAESLGVAVNVRRMLERVAELWSERCEVVNAYWVVQGELEAVDAAGGVHVDCPKCGERIPLM